MDKGKKKDVKKPSPKSKKAEPAKEEIKEKTPQEIEALLYNDLQNYVDLVNKTASTKEVRHLHRALRYTFVRSRRKITLNMLHKLVDANFPDSPSKAQLFGFLPEPSAMEVDTPATSGSDVSSAPVVPAEKPTTITPELEVYLWLLCIVHLLDIKKNEVALKAVDSLLEKLGETNRRTMDPLSAKVYFYYSRVYEVNNKLADIRPNLLKLQRTATLRHNYDGQVVLLNLLLRNYLHYNLYEQADKLASKTELVMDKAATNELARYHFYLGRINAIQLSYSDAFRNLQQALRRGPRDTARGFRSSVTQFLIVVQLLLGEIPERSIFRTTGIQHTLKPYLAVTQAVRSGDTALFTQCVTKFEAAFKKDHTFTLVQRLHQNVIKTGLRKINTAYSRISFEDICKRLHLDSPLDAELIVTKAISDGIIDAKINPTGKFIQSQENIDVYSTNEPERQFHQRVEFCLQIHNDAVKAMRYLPGVDKSKEEDKEKKEDKVKDEDEVEISDMLDDDE